MSRHRAPRSTVVASYDVDFIPTHCAGTSCFHTHPGEAPLPLFASVDAPLPVQCDRRGAHGSHDVTSEDGDFRCPGRASMSLPAPRLRERVLQSRAGIKKPGVA